MDLKQILNDLQKNCDELYKEYGASNDIIQLQVAINNLRNTFDIPDADNMIEADEGFVQ